MAVQAGEGQAGVSVYFTDVRQPDGSLQTIEIMALSLAEALQKANAEYGIEAVLSMSGSLAFGRAGGQPL